MNLTTTSAPQTGTKTTMRAVVARTYGPPEALRIEAIEKPALAGDGVLVRVRASSINPAEWYSVTGSMLAGRLIMGAPFKPKNPYPGVDFAGVVEAVGPSVTQFKPGDEVFGARLGAWAEYVHVREDRNIVHKPANVTFEQAASVGTAAFTALQGLRTHGRLQLGENLLINGASGGVGTFAIQIAKALGARVTAVCSTRNLDQAHALGADAVVDYTREDFTRSSHRYDLLLDIAGSRSFAECARVLAPNATFVAVGSATHMQSGAWKVLQHLAAVRFGSLRSKRRVVIFVARMTRSDLLVLQDLMASGKVTPIIDKRYPLSDVRAAFAYLGQGHAAGKVVLHIASA
jgi:NADPH:quinone reductase-like Zn-dependent oxidoreductase